MEIRVVRDVIGEPETWPNHLHVAGEGPTEIRGAIISQVFSAGTDIAVCTKGGPSGATFSIFAVEDKELRDRVERALRPGLEVHEAAAADIRAEQHLTPGERKLPRRCESQFAEKSGTPATQ